MVFERLFVGDLACGNRIHHDDRAIAPSVLRFCEEIDDLARGGDASPPLAFGVLAPVTLRERQSVHRSALGMNTFHDGRDFRGAGKIRLE